MFGSCCSVLVLTVIVRLTKLISRTSPFTIFLDRLDLQNVASHRTAFRLALFFDMELTVKVNRSEVQSHNNNKAYKSSANGQQRECIIGGQPS